MTSRKLVYTALFAALTAAGAFLRIPLGVSSITLQFLFTAMAGVLLGAGCGALSQAVYVALGLIGLPIFYHRRRLRLRTAAHLRLSAGADPHCRRNRRPDTAQCLSGAGGAGLRGGTGGAVRRGHALYGADPQRLHGQGHERVRASVGGYAALSARRRHQNRRDGAAVSPAAQAHPRTGVSGAYLQRRRGML